MLISEKNILAFIKLLETEELKLSDLEQQRLLDLSQQISENLEQISTAILTWCENCEAGREIIRKLRQLRAGISEAHSEQERNIEKDVEIPNYKLMLQQAIQQNLQQKSSEAGISTTDISQSQQSENTNTSENKHIYYTDIDCPHQVWKEKTLTVTVRLTIQPLKHQNLNIEQLEVDSNLPVIVKIDAPEFELDNDQPKKEIYVHPNKDSSRIFFCLKPRQVCSTKIHFEFWQNHKPIGRISIPIEITEYAPSANFSLPYEMSFNGSANTQIPDLILYIKYDLVLNPHFLNFTLVEKGKSEIKFSYRRLHENLESYVASLYAHRIGISNRLFAKNSDTNFSVKELNNNIQEVGRRIWSELIPDDLKKYYAINRHHWYDQTLLIMSDEPYIPWELMLPYDQSGSWEEENPWCITMKMTRWLRQDEQGNANPLELTQLKINNLAGVFPKFPELKFIEDEQKYILEQLLKKYNLCNVSPSNSSLSSIRVSLEQSKYNWLHIASHGGFSHISEDCSAILLENNEFINIYNFLGAKIQGHIYNNRPAFFFNACHSGRQSWTLAGLGGWPNHLIKSGASLVLAPMWEVEDYLASKFAKTFYQELLDSKVTIGEAVRRSRLAVKNINDPTFTWLAYSVYAHPNAQIIQTNV
jgi:hypothetical protein